MKNLNVFWSALAIFALLFTTSCSKDDPGTEGMPKEKEKVSLSFTGALQQFNKAMATKQSQGDPIPGCAEDQVPTYVTVALKDSEDNWIPDDTPDGAGDYWIEIGVIPVDVSVDSDGDGAQNYLTFEAEELELDEGSYSLEYFAVYNAGGDQIWLAPRSDEDYGPNNFKNFVEKALPIPITLAEGTKHYVEVEVLCYDEHFARQYGYLFFDFEKVPLTYLCLFANICDATGRHFPGNIRVMVWEFSDDVPAVYDDSNLLVDVTNTVTRNDEGEVTYAEPVCIPLPDRGTPTMVHMEVYSLDVNGNETLIEIGDFTEEETKTLDDVESDENPENLENYLHLRYGPYCGENSDPCLVNDPVYYIDNFDNGAFETGLIQTDYTQVAVGYNALYPEGTFAFTNNPRNVHKDWENFDNGNNMFILNGDTTDDAKKVYFRLTESNVCEEDYYYVTFDIRNVLDVEAGGENDVILAVVVNQTTTLAETITVDEGQGWKKVGLRLRSNTNGDFDVQFIDANTAASGNDFALDNIVISNDQSIMDGLGDNPSDLIIIQP